MLFASLCRFGNPDTEAEDLNQPRKQMRSLGFGLERIGLLVLGAPRLFAALLLLVFVAAVSTLPSTSFDGRLIDILSEHQAFRSYSEVKENFRDASHDAFLMIESPDLLTVDGIEALRFLHIDLSLIESIESVFSIFSLGEIDPEGERFRRALPPVFTSDPEIRTTLVRLHQDQPVARALIDPEASIAVIVATLEAPINADNREMAALVAELGIELDRITPEGFAITVTGIPTIQATVVDSLRDDQWRMALFGILIGSAIGYVVFRSLIAALVCAAPAGVAVIWLFGLFNALSIEINFLFAILPSLALILALVDSIVFFFHWQSANAENGNLRSNLKSSILRIGPASAMTSITTAIAFVSLAYAQNPALQTLAWLGVAAVALAFLSFITVLPLLCLVVTRLPGSVGRRKPSFAQLGQPIGRWAIRAPLRRIGLAVLIVLVLGTIHFQVDSNFEIDRYLPPGTSVVESEVELGDRFGGTVPLYALVQVPDGEAFHDPPSRDRIAAVTAIFAEAIGEGRTISLANFWDSVDGAQANSIGEALAGADPAMLDRILAHDQRSMLVTAQLPSIMDGEKVEALVEAIRKGLSDAGLAGEVVLTGFPVLSAVEIPALIDELRFGMLIAVVLAVAALAVASGSPGLALSCLIPNILPILALEAVLWLLGYDHDLTSVVALTVAFGIGIDNAVHLINMYRVNRNEAMAPPDALANAVRIVGPALMASTAILGLSYLATQTSAMPSIGLLGQLIIATLVAALIANLVFLPSFITLLDRAFRRHRRGLVVADSGVS